MSANESQTRLLLVPLDDIVVFPNMNVTLTVDVGDEDRVLLVPKHEGEYAKVGTVAEVTDRIRLPGEGGLPGMNQVTPILPEDGAPVAPGDEWDTSYSQDVPFGEIDQAGFRRNRSLGSQQDSKQEQPGHVKCESHRPSPIVGRDCLHDSSSVAQRLRRSSATRSRASTVEPCKR